MEVLHLGETRFNMFFSPEELPAQLKSFRRGNIMCAAVVANMWRGGTYSKSDWKSWIEGGQNNV